MSNRIGGGWRGSGYVGTKASQPPETYYVDRDPTPFDTKPYSLLDLWLNTVTDQPWILVSLAGTSNSKGLVAQWVKFGAGDLQTLTGDDNIPVPPINFNINLHGAVGSGLVFTGNPGTATITLSTTGGGGVGQDITGDVGGSVPFDAAGNIFLLGGLGSGIVVAGNPGINTLTINASGGGHFGESLQGDTGGIVPFDATGNIHVIANQPALNCGLTVSLVGNPGTHTLTLNVTDNANTIIGTNSGNLGFAGATENVGLGSGILRNFTGIAAHNVAIGNLSLQSMTTGRANTAVGQGALTLLTTGDSNVAVGFTALSTITTGSDNVAIGNGSLSNLQAGTSGNTAVGNDSMNTATTATGCVAVGSTALFSLQDAPSNTAIGSGCLTSHTTGLGGNTGVGTVCLFAMTTGVTNTAVGFNAGSRVTTGGRNTLLGSSAAEILTTGSFNVIIGEAAATNGSATAGLVSGDFNVVIGLSAAVNWTTNETNNIIIRNGGVVGDNNIIRIGSNGGPIVAHTKCFISGIRGITTDVNDAVAVLIDSSGQLGTVSSSIRYKENVNEMGSYSDDILRLRPVTFNYKNRSSERVSVGLIAEEVGQVMPDLVVFDEDGITDTVRYHDLVPLLLNELQKAVTRIEQLERHISDIERIMLKKCS